MDDLTRVKAPSSPLEGRSAKVIALVVVGILVAITKPWGAGAPPPVARATAVPSPRVEAAPSPTPFDPLANYNHEIFGIYEPEPRWELWPAGYLVSFGYATRIGSLPAGSAKPSSAPTTPGSSVRPVRSPVSTGEGPNWPATIMIIDGNHLGLVGINTPLGYRVTARLMRIDERGEASEVAIVLPESDWPRHFTIVAMDDGTGREALESWPVGDYRLELAIEPGGIARSVEIHIEDATTDGGARPSPSPASTSGAPPAPSPRAGS